MDCSTPGLLVHHQFLKPAQTHVHCIGDTIQPSHLLSSPSSPAFNLSSIRVFSNESALCIKWPKYWSFSFNISPSNEHSGLISFRMDWLGLLAVQGTLKRLLQHHSSKALIWRCSAFFIVQLSHPRKTTGKTITLTRWTFVGKVMSLLFSMLSRLVINIITWKGKTKPQSCKSPLSHKIYSLLSCSWLQVKMYIVEINEYVMLHITYVFPLACIFKDLFHIST